MYRYNSCCSINKPTTNFKLLLLQAPLFSITGVPIFCTNGDYYTDVLSYMHSHHLDGILTDDPAFAPFNFPRLYAAHDLKLTYRGSLETKEYLLQKVLTDNQILPERLPLLASLLGKYVIASSLRKQNRRLSRGVM